ncbi:Fe2+-dependent dioxygenase [Pseudoxanthomonas japonensis]|uniref:Fe2+-dependent dioxygenase n=1 Tax=Pseudoxanthomonas japonensis TaxID=69284 RepID=UPI001390CD08|nr:Fe2+-dependent dioxygenase [Pseudoxanthomonas japonensis]
MLTYTRPRGIKAVIAHKGTLLMILTLPDLITPDELATIKQMLATAQFSDGKATAGELLHKAKNNLQIPANHPVMKGITNLVMEALGRNDPFMSVAQPRRLAAMLVSRYEPGMAYGAHVDSAVMGAPNHVRSDVSFTIFLNEPDTYKGGELAFEIGGTEAVFKPAARSAICYPTGQLHWVKTVEEGERLAIVGWVQSLVRDPAVRELLHDLSTARELLVGKEGAERSLELVNKCYSNLLRRNAEP